MLELWERALSPLRAQLSDQTFATWLAPLRLDRIEAPHVFLHAPSRFHADWVKAHYGVDLTRSVTEVAGEALRIEIDVALEMAADRDPEMDASHEDLSPAPSMLGAVRLELQANAAAFQREDPQHAQRSPSQRPPALANPRLRTRGTPSRGMPQRRNYELPFGAPATATAPSEAPLPAAAEYALNPRYNFDNFVVGPSNQLAHAAGVAASASPGKRYNPLFIYSKVGLGKTHLVNAVGHAVQSERSDARVYFISAERFTNEFIWALQHRRIDEFRARYRQHCDVLVIDDIQFLAGREQTQEEFFHTFNALYHADKQIVVTSDRYPQEIGEMQDRLVSRFQWGMVADIQAPELDTRIAILQKKAEQERIPLAADVALYVAQRVESNVRELEGTLLRLAMRADLMGRTIDLELSRSMLGVSATTNRAERATTVEDIQRATAEYFALTVRELCGDRRHRGVSQPRMIAMWIARERLSMSYPEIGRRFGGKDHTTVMSAQKKIAGLLEQREEPIVRAVDAIERKLGLK
jgi:chromosomal replication initiator protein